MNWKTILLKCLYHSQSPRLDATSVKNPVVFFTEIEKKILKFIWKTQNCLNCESNLGKNELNWKDNIFLFQNILQSSGC